MPRSLRLSFLLVTLLLTACAGPERRYSDDGTSHRLTAEERQELRAAYASLKLGRKSTLPPTIRAGHFLDAASDAAALWKGNPDERSELITRRLYNRATGRLTELLREHPRLWKRDLAILSPRTGQTYQLRVVGPGQGLWDPAYFTEYEPAHLVNDRGFRQRLVVLGYGAPLVGIRNPRSIGKPRESFSEMGIVTASVTATLDFAKASENAPVRTVTLALYNPLKAGEAQIGGKKRTLAADFTAPLAYYPRRSELLAGLEAMLNVERFLKGAGLHRYEPIDPNRIPIIYIHGLASTPQMWLDVINEVNADPVLRAHYQPWTYRYPSGLPLVYAALGLREQLEELRKTHPMPRGYILVGHSMGGLVSRLQVSNVGRQIWDSAMGKKADRLHASVPEHSPLKRATIFEADPDAQRIIFICTPHRGSDIASGSIGHFATRLIRMPATLVNVLENTVGGSLELVTGVRGNRFPTSIQSLSPDSPTLKVMNSIAPASPHHSIIGDRGRGDTPNSSDGVVPYWSSHLDTAQTELIVPGPHGSYDLPQTVDELRRILHQQLGDERSKKSATRPVLALTP